MLRERGGRCRRVEASAAMAARPRSATGARARPRRHVRCGVGIAAVALAICVVLAAVVPLALAQSTCSAYLDLTSYFIRTTLQVDARNHQDIIPLNNMLYSNSKTPITVSGGSRISLTVRVEATSNRTRNALAAAIVFDLVGGRSRRVLTDTSWRWSPARSTGETRAAQRHSVALTEEYYPSDAEWLTDEPDGRSDDVRWSTFSKTLPRGVCAGVAPGPPKIPGVVAARCAATGVGPPKVSRWGIIAAAVLGTLTLLSLAAAITALVLLRRVQRRLHPAGERDSDAEERAAAKLAAMERRGGACGGSRSSGGVSGGSGGSQDGGDCAGGGGDSGNGGRIPTSSSPSSLRVSSGGVGPPPFPPHTPTEPSPWQTVSSMGTLTASLAPPLPTHGQQLSGRVAAAATAAATMVVRRACDEQAAAAAAQRAGRFSNEVGSTISSAGAPPHGGYTPAYALGFPPPPPMPSSLMSPQGSVTGLVFPANGVRPG